MNHNTRIAALLCATLLAAACTEWSDHYDEAALDMAEGNFTTYDGSVRQYLSAAGDISTVAKLLADAGVATTLTDDKQYTLLVCDDQTYNAALTQTDPQTWANYCVSDMAVAPENLKAGFGLQTRSGKAVWVYADNGRTTLDDSPIQKTVRCRNGYIYYVGGVLPYRPSAYEYLKSLGSDYSEFQRLVTRYDSRVFDKEHSKPTSVSADGMVLYDSVWVTTNSLMDRYTADGVDYWNMRDESYTTTMFIPTNEQINNAVETALANVPVWLNREATDADRQKFEDWIVKACFANRRLKKSEVDAAAPDFYAVGAYIKKKMPGGDEIYYSAADSAYWRPAVQKAEADDGVKLSNGTAYYLRTLKIPNHVVIYRVKSRFYELWDNMSAAEQKKYFHWTHWIDPMIVQDAQGEYMLNDQLPTMYYHVLTAIPDEEAEADSLHCSVTYDGLTLNETGDGVLPCCLPAGEYYLRMGFKHSLPYSVSIWFDDQLVTKDMVLYAQGSNFHFDRGAASEVPKYGEGGIAYPENFDVDYWQTQDPKAIAYDTDGYTVGIVKITQPGNFTITVDSKDNGYLYGDRTKVRNKNNINQLMMYHWCLRPTKNNY